MFIQDLIEQLEKVSLSNNDIENILLDDRVKVIDYNLFDPIDNLDEIYENGKKQAIIFLLRGTSEVGHWVVLIADYDNHILRYFGSYGLSLEEVLNIATSNSKKLIMLIQQKTFAGWIYDENRTQLQAFNKDTTTCGMWCILRTAFRYLSNQEFVKLIKTYSDRHKFKYDEACISLMSVSLIRVIK